MALGSIAQPTPVSSGASNNSSVQFDNSGFVVSVGSSGTSSSKTGLPGAAQSMQAVTAGIGGLLGNPVLLLIGVALFVYLKKK